MGGCCKCLRNIDFYNCVRPSDFQRGDHSGWLRKSAPTTTQKNPAGIALEILFIDVGSEKNCRTFRFFDFSSIFSYFTRFQRNSFDLVSNPGLWLLRKSKGILWKQEKFSKSRFFLKKSKYLKWKLVFYHNKQLPRGPQPIFFLKTQPH